MKGKPKMQKTRQISLKKIGLLLIGVILIIMILRSIIGCISAATGTITEAQAAEFLQKYGWTTEKGTVKAEEVHIPSSFSEVYERYNAIQRKQGYDLTKYKGEKVLKYTFVITTDKNYENVEAHIRTYGRKVIGGDICSTELGGFMTGFEG